MHDIQSVIVYSKLQSTMALFSIPDDVLQFVMLFFDAEDMCKLESTCSHMGKMIEKTNQWKRLCDRDFELLPRYNCARHGYPNASYKVSYREIFTEVRRTQITPEDLESLSWYFNFAPAAGGRGKETLVECKFEDSCLILDEYPPLPYFVDDDSPLLRIAFFPPHVVSRLSNGEWLITNDNVALVSFGPGRKGEFNNWGHVHC